MPKTRPGRGRCFDPGGGGHVRAAGFLPWLARHGLAWQRWRGVVGGRRRRRRLFDGLGDVGGGPLVLTHLTHPRTVANPTTAPEVHQRFRREVEQWGPVTAAVNGWGVAGLFAGRPAC